MVSVPIVALLGLGIFLSLTKGKGTAWFGLLCLLMGVWTANTQVGRTLVELTNTAIQTAVGMF